MIQVVLKTVKGGEAFCSSPLPLQENPSYNREMKIKMLSEKKERWFECFVSIWRGRCALVSGNNFNQSSAAQTPVATDDN